MSKSKIIICSLIGLIAAGAVVGLVVYHRLMTEPAALLSSLSPKQGISLNRIHHVATRDGVKEWSLDAESAQYLPEDNKTVFKDVSVTFFLKDGKDVSLNSSDGILFTNTKDMEVWGDVVVLSGPYEFNTDKLRYEHKTRTIFTETPISIKGNRMKITGDSMSYGIQTEQVSVKGKVNAVFESRAL